MDFFKNIFPTGENKVTYAPSREDKTSERGGGNKTTETKVPLTVIKSEWEAPEESVTTEKENANEKTREIIEKAFSNIFSKESNKNVKIIKQGGYKETSVGTYITTGFFPNGGMLYKLREMYLAEYSDDENMNEENADKLIRNFCLDNIDGIKGTEDAKNAVKAICNNVAEIVPKKIEENHEKLEKDIDDAWDRICDIAEDLGKKNNADRDSGLFSDEAKSFFNEEAQKLKSLSAEVNGRILSDGSISQYSYEVLNFFQSHLEKLTQLSEEYDEEKEKFRKPEPLAIAPESIIKNVRTKKEKDEGRLVYRLERMTYALEVWKSNIEKLNLAVGDELKPLSYYVKKVTDVKKDGIVGEYFNRLNVEIKNNENKIKDIWETKKSEFSRQGKRSKSLAEKMVKENKGADGSEVKRVEGELGGDFREVLDESAKKNRAIADESRRDAEKAEKKKKNELEKKIKERFSNAIEKVIDVSQSEFDSKYVALKTGRELSGDIRAKIREYMGMSQKFLFDPVDAHSQEERDAWSQISDTVDGILDENNDKQVVVVDGKRTYVVTKNVAEGVIDDKRKNESFIEGVPDSISEHFADRANVCLEEIRPIIENSEDYKLLSEEELSLQVENFIKIFIRKDILKRKDALEIQFRFNDESAKKMEQWILNKIFQK